MNAALAATEPFDPFFEQIQDVYEAIGAGRLPWSSPPPEAIADACAEIEQTGLFEDGASSGNGGRRSSPGRNTSP